MREQSDTERGDAEVWEISVSQKSDFCVLIYSHRDYSRNLKYQGSTWQDWVDLDAELICKTLFGFLTSITHTHT